MEKNFPDEMISKIQKTPVIAVLVIDSAEDVVPLAHALMEGGVFAMELTLRTPAALEALERVLRDVPDMLAGIGTILNADQVRSVRERGAAFGVSPGLNSSVVKAAKESSLPFAPGVMTPSEIEAAYAMGCNVMKLYPVELIGGIDYLKHMSGTYAHLGIKYIPLGGVSQENLTSYLERPEVLAIGGSWLAPRKLIQEKAWKEISTNCKKAMEVAEKVRKNNG
jgi:2-dehydro-3-deoxyphosphogluconate aldolase/(4S)-4-hydroxy-2-oxoglutarate aldolase